MANKTDLQINPPKLNILEIHDTILSSNFFIKFIFPISPKSIINNKMKNRTGLNKATLFSVNIANAINPMTKNK